MYYTIDCKKCQDVNLDKELKTKFAPKRRASELLAQSYSRLGYDGKAERVSECGTELEFTSDYEAWKLTKANFCRDRLCPMCAWRRSYKIFAQVSQIMNVIAGDYVFLFLTLTVPNCDPDELVRTLDDMQKAWYRLTQYKRFKSVVCGFFKALEVTRNSLVGTYHPHYHIILAVRKSYFVSQDYINHDEWLNLWRKAKKDPTITQVDIRRCKPKEEIGVGEAAVKALSSAVSEVSKYSVKSTDYIIPGDTDTSDEVVFTLGAALHGRRLCSFGGCFDEARKKLQLDDCEDGDLVHLDNLYLRSDVAVMVRKYNWSCGAYKLVSVRRDVDINIECDEDENEDEIKVIKIVPRGTLKNTTCYNT